MRVGTNPMKHRAALPPYKRHRIVMAVYIPSREGYFASALEIFQMSFESLLSTVDAEHVSITVIDNASIPEVGSILETARAEGRVDRVVRHAVNRGKPDAVAGELRASFERFVTLVDCDVLFLPGWLASVEAVFEAWPEAGAVSPSAQTKAAFHQDASTWMFGVGRAAVRLGKYVADADLTQFARSVGNPDLYAGHELARQYVLCRKDAIAAIGAGHFVVTLRRKCYERFAYQPRLEGTGHGMRMIDEQVDRCRRLRLSTTRSHVLHLGNTVEPWMVAMSAEVRAAARVALRPAGSPLDVEPPTRRGAPLWLVRQLMAPVMFLARVLQRRGWDGYWTGHAGRRA